MAEVTLFSAFALAVAIAWYAIPPIIRVARIKKLYDEPLELRKIHTRSIPPLGGIAIFFSFLITISLFIGSVASYSGYLLASGVIVFIIGLKDDLVGMDPYKKFAAQLLAAFIITFLADIRFTNFYGLFGIREVSWELSYPVSILFIVFTINAFNLIDGIDGLAASIGIMVCTTFGIVFYQMEHMELALIAFSLMGALLGFLRFNYTPARIFMGDSGSYTIGFVVAILAIQFIELNKFGPVEIRPFVSSAPAVALGMLIIPIFDTLRVFFMRLVKGVSPFTADRNHLHHRLVDCGMSHPQATLTLAGVNLLFIALCFYLQDISTSELVILVLLLAQFINIVLWLYDLRVKRQKKMAELPSIDQKKDFPGPSDRKAFIEEYLNS